VPKAKKMITTLTGSNQYMVDEDLHKQLSDYEKEYGDFAVEKIDGQEAEYSLIEGSINNLPFLSPKKLIILKYPSSNKDFIKNARNLLEDIPDSNELIILETSLDKRTDYYKFLKKQTDYREYAQLSENEIIKWLTSLATAKGGEIKSQDARYLVEVAGLDQVKLVNEMTKLITNDPVVTRQAIDYLVEPIPQSTIFQLIDASFKGNNKELLNIYEDQRKQKVEPQQIIAMLAWQLHILAIIKSSNKSPGEIAKLAKINPFVVNKSYSLAKSVSQTRLRQIINDVSEVDIKLKNQSIDTDSVMKYLLLSINE
jgi:DNA polymerase-3 subunit delta